MLSADGEHPSGPATGYGCPKFLCTCMHESQNAHRCSCAWS